ncbi:hypothetical protein DFH08DRAFT_976798 [Mycena albidolilacea]|uniref:Uncharacterized protein n=1 Tax=Mycena albidolilacea TaxID=1033008 RepID=A0AAD6Z2B9_9AGAR|nr:hypothetical protein DFH08DRAFT_976798 [Mycena albidolilacea]
MLTSSIPIFAAEKQLADANWSLWEERIISSLCGRGLYGYPSGSILCPQHPMSLHVTSANSTSPSTEEWDLRDAMASAIIYQNVVDPRVHGLSAKVLKGIPMDTLCSLKLTSRCDLPAHLEALTKLRSDALDVGAHCQDEEYIAIVLASLPFPEFSSALLALYEKKFSHEVINYLCAHWDLVYKASVTATGIAQALAANAGNSGGTGSCGNCHIGPHHWDNCWAHGSGKEEYATAWYKAPNGMEPCQVLIEAANIAMAAIAAAVAAATAAITQANTPALAPSTPTAAAAYVSPMPIYVCATYNDNKDSDIQGHVLPF